MKNDKLLDLMGQIDDDNIMSSRTFRGEAAPAKRTVRRAAWRWAAAAAAFVIIAVGAFAVVRFGSESKQQQAAEPVNTPDPYEGVYYRAVEPTDKPVLAGSASRRTLTKDGIAQDAAYIFKGIVQSMKEYELLCVREDSEGYPKQYGTRIECTITDPIYGDLNNGEKISAIYAGTSYIKGKDYQVLESGKEYIFILYEYKDSPADEIVFDWKRLCPYAIISSREGFMPVNGDTVTYDTALGSLDGKAELNGTLTMMDGEVKAYTANYEDVKAMLIQIMEKR